MYYSDIESDLPSENDKASSFGVLFPTDPSEQKFDSNHNVDY